MTPTSAPNATAHTAAQAASQATTRPRQAQGGQGASPFAQLLQGMAADPADTAETVSQPVARPEEAAREEEGTKASERAPRTHRERDAAEDATSQATPEPVIADLAMPLRSAGSLAAAARTKGGTGIEATRGHRPTVELEDGLDAARGQLSAAHAGAGEVQAVEAKGMDLPGWQTALGAAPVNLAPAEPAAGAAPAGDFSLPSLGSADMAPAAPAEASAPAQATLAPPPGSPAFGPALGAQLSTWLQDGVQYATLELNPQDMGPIDVRIALRDGRTEVMLGADVAATRAALAEALPALGEALGDVGLTLTGGSVSDQTGQHARQGEGQAQRGFALPAWLAPARDEGATAEATRRPVQRGLIDLVA
jgi:flagellar hook-length control protein FliK